MRICFNFYRKKTPSLIIIENGSLIHGKSEKSFSLFKKLERFFFKNSSYSLYAPFFAMRIGESKEFIFDPYKSPINLGYLLYKGFSIVDVRDFKENQKIITIKRVSPLLKQDKKYSWLIKLPRTGKNGKRIYVYKFRTMQPYAEYLQSDMIKINGFNSDGTIKEDFRITKIGKFLRKYWLDELPMLLNFLKGDLKLIGVRPLSDAMLSQYPKEFVPFRNRFKPGLIPPYYIDNPQSFEEIIQSEERYLKQYEKAPLKTDFIYFLKFLDRILFKGVRSK